VNRFWMAILLNRTETLLTVEEIPEASIGMRITLTSKLLRELVLMQMSSNLRSSLIKICQLNLIPHRLYRLE
jgi:hypothetical protein